MSLTKSTDVFVIGGGPAGLAAAIAARQKGFSVIVADRAQGPIDKACGEGLMPDGLKALAELGVSLDECETGSFRGIKFIGAEGRVEADFPEGRGIGIRRMLLHNALQAHAERVGVRTQWGVRVTAIAWESVTVDGQKVRARWIIGADGQNSQTRQWAGLSKCTSRDRRIGMRQHFKIKPWSDFVEIYWSMLGQAYVTPISANEMCVALISKKRFASFDSGLANFPELRDRLSNAPRSSNPKGAVTIYRHLDSVCRQNIALIGEASGSVDAITGEGLAMAFRQALGLSEALVEKNLALYHREHRKISKLPEFMANTMLLMDKSSWLRTRTLRALVQKPRLFEQMLSIHVGAKPLVAFGTDGIVNVGWNLLSTRA
jgi:flavin-dependent dehydrogenase